MNARVIPIGCPTAEWSRRFFVDESVHQLIERDLSLVELLSRKVSDHGRRLPAMLRLGEMRSTVAWRSRHRGDKDCLITTRCGDDTRLHTRVHLVRSPSHL